ncbi:hypothetical protein P152DRAFT_450073 [Eremomyces bilateralis CBS 781.70]|uniref:UBA domain-containing protein n=1 Tax=Eremomyces bilateralis CBS 781.70 TaxID=1392243 RepID=A0A6G1G1J7_9PEZI|nr:uncharacterized protein P152DRAFT_450073 [Eremomyces bilateralis CBS 781.70]KAF1811801.1 hypothetical protein P152DRAFT_450073 [Eremomyces bilateralis CBS 781.70]
MPAPIAKGIIIAASVLFAAGIALYESPTFRQWVDESRRKVAIALYSLGDGVNPPSRTAEGEEESEEARQQRREEIVRRNRAELIRRAQAEGIAVDLDELAAIGTEKIKEHIKDIDEKMASLKEMGFTDEERNSTLLAAYDGNLEQTVEQLVYLSQTAANQTAGNQAAGNHTSTSRADRSKSFDSIVAHDGSLLSSSPEPEMSQMGRSTALSTSNTLRHRGQGNSGFLQGSAFSNPFGDEHAIMYDAESMSSSAQGQTESDIRQRHGKTATLAGGTPAPLIDLTSSVPEAEAEAELNNADILSTTPSFDSLYDDPDIPRPSRRSIIAAVSTPAPIAIAIDPPSRSNTPTGTGALTPTSDGFNSEMSVVASNADDIGILSSVPPSDAGEANADRMSDMGGLSDMGEEARSEMSFSDVGISTPGSWTDVESDGWSEAGNGEPREVAVR